MCWAAPEIAKIRLPNGEIKTYHNIVSTLANSARNGDTEEISKILTYTNYHANSNLHGTTMLNEAVYACNEDAVRWLVEMQANPHALTGGSKYISTYTPSAHLVARNSNCENKEDILAILESSGFHNENAVESAGEVHYHEL